MQQDIDQQSYETYLLKKYDPLIHKMVHKFMGTSLPYDKGRSEYEDLYQAARLALIQMYRAGELDEERITSAKSFRIIDAMRNCSYDNFEIHIGKKKYFNLNGGFVKADIPGYLNGLYSRDDNNNDEFVYEDVYPNLYTALNDKWTEQLSDDDKKIVRLIENGYTTNDLLELGILSKRKDIYNLRNRLYNAYVSNGACLSSKNHKRPSRRSGINHSVMDKMVCCK